MNNGFFISVEFYYFWMDRMLEKHIINTIKNNKAEGMRLLFKHYYRSLVLCANEYLKDLGTGEDIVQELFLKLWITDHVWDNINTSLEAYLYTAVKNSCYTYRQQKDVLRNTEEFDSVEIPIETVSLVDDKEMNRVMLAVEELPNRMRQVVDVVLIRGLKYREAATELNISVNTVKFLLKEGVKRLRERFSSD